MVHHNLSYFILFCFCILLTQKSIAEDFSYNAGVSASYEDNVGRGEGDINIFSDSLAKFFGSVSFNQQLNTQTSILYKGAAQWTHYNKYTLLNNLKLDLGATLNFKADSNFTTPWYSLGIKYQESIFTGYDLRDAYTFTIDASVGKRVTDKLKLMAGIGYLDQNARTDENGLLGGKLYDVEFASLFASADYSLNSFIFYGKYTFQDGDVISNALIPVRKAIVVSDEIQVDKAFQGIDEYGSLGYRLDAKSHIVDLGVNYPINHISSLDFSVQLIDVRAVGDNNYKNYIVNVGYFHRF